MIYAGQFGQRQIPNTGAGIDEDDVDDVAFTEADDGLMFLVRLDSTPEGDRELDLLRANRHEGVSIRYSPLKNAPRSGPPWWRAKIELRELSLTDHGQYADARVHAIRSVPEGDELEQSPAYVRPADIDALLDWQPPSM